MGEVKRKLLGNQGRAMPIYSNMSVKLAEIIGTPENGLRRFGFGQGPWFSARHIESSHT
jgi:hypothetical protein